MSGTATGLTNWAGNYRYRAREVHHPQTLDELRRLLERARSAQALSTRHTFSAIGDAEELVALERLAGAGEIAIDREAMTVTVGPAVTYAQLAEALEPAGLALANMASLPHIAVIGAAATGTHGSGDRLGNLATSIRAMRIVTSAGDVLDIGQDDPRFPGMVVHLGALGVVVRATLAVEPSYPLSQRVYENMEWGELEANLDAITTAGRSVSVFHCFGERVREVWVKGDPAAPVQLGEPGPWCDRLPHFRAGFTPSAGEEIQSEYFVARADGIAAITALREQVGERIRPLLYVSETRTIAADELWMSPHYGRDSIGIHFTWHREPQAVRELCVEVEHVLAPFAPRPHWGKAFEATAMSVALSHPRVDDFLALRDELDPRGVFVNEWLEDKLLGDATHPTV
jgi:xylitol oxidase